MDQKLLGTIELLGMEFEAYHGCLEEERLNGNLFVVDFKGTAELGKAAWSDDLEDTVDYGRLYDLVASEMAKPSNLLENVAGRIVEAVSEHIPEFLEFQVSVAKRCPPVKGPCAWSRVTLSRGSRALYPGSGAGSDAPLPTTASPSHAGPGSETRHD